MQLDIDVGSDPVLAVFPFKNDSKVPVVITDLKSSCGCSTPTVTERRIPPGGTGVVSVTYEPGDRVGMQVSHLTITTDEPATKPMSLTLRMNIHPAIECLPKLVRWNQGADMSAQTITIKRIADAVTITGVKSLSDSMEAQISPFDERSKSWTLQLRPKSTDALVTAKVEVRATVNGRETTYLVFGLVR